MNKENNIINIILKSILLFPILTVLQGISFLNLINKIWMGVVILELIISFKDLKYKKIDFFVFIITIIIHIIALVYTKDTIYNINTIFYLLFWVFFYIFCARNEKNIKEFFYNNIKYLKIIVISWTTIVLISTMFKSSFVSGAFVSFSGTSFRLMPTVLVICALIFYLINITNNKKYYVLLLLPIFCAFMGFSRVYFGIFILFMMCFIYLKVKNKLLIIMLLSFFTIFSIVIIPKTSIGEKFNRTSYTETSYYDFWGTITSGRSVFWEIDINSFNKLPLVNQFVGNGYNYVFDINEQLHGNKIWAHNDIINLLMNFGYIGVTIYLYAICILLKTFLKKSIPFPVRFIYLLAIFINSNLNMSYTYLCAMISYPIFLIAFNLNIFLEKEGNFNEKQKNINY